MLLKWMKSANQTCIPVLNFVKYPWTQFQRYGSEIPQLFPQDGRWHHCIPTPRCQWQNYKQALKNGWSRRVLSDTTSRVRQQHPQKHRIPEVGGLACLFSLWKSWVKSHIKTKQFFFKFQNTGTALLPVFLKHNQENENMQRFHEGRWILSTLKTVYESVLFDHIPNSISVNTPYHI